jgi:hypothetical protein
MHAAVHTHVPVPVPCTQADFRNMTLRVVELDEDSLAAQAKTYTGADVLIQMHGAALGNVIFLPLGAVYIDVVPENNDDKHAWAYFMLKDYATLQASRGRGGRDREGCVGGWVIPWLTVCVCGWVGEWSLKRGG